MPITYDESGVPYDSAAYTYDGDDAPKTRVSQLHAEVVRYNDTSAVRVSQVHIEVVRLTFARPSFGWGINGPSWQVV